jgi:hypothetical protein
VGCILGQKRLAFDYSLCRLGKQPAEELAHPEKIWCSCRVKLLVKRPACTHIHSTLEYWSAWKYPGVEDATVVESQKLSMFDPCFQLTLRNQVHIQASEQTIALHQVLDP